MPNDTNNPMPDSTNQHTPQPADLPLDDERALLVQAKAALRSAASVNESHRPCSAATDAGDTATDATSAARPNPSASMMRLLTQYEPLLRRAAGQAHFRTIHDDALAEACVSFVRAVRDYDAAQGVPFAGFAKARVYGNLRTLARRVIRTWQREATVDDRREEGFWDSIEDEDAARALTRLERRSMLAAALRALSERERDVITRLYFQNETQKTAAAALGLTQQAVAAIKKRALKKMKEAIEDTR